MERSWFLEPANQHLTLGSASPCYHSHFTDVSWRLIPEPALNQAIGMWWDVMVQSHGPGRVLCGGKDGSLNRRLCLHEHMQTPCARFFMCELGLQSIYILGPLWSWNRMVFVKHLGQSLSTEYSSFLEFRGAEWPQPCGQQRFLLLSPQKGQMAVASRFFGVSLARRTVISPGAFAVSGDHKWASPWPSGGSAVLCLQMSLRQRKDLSPRLDPSSKGKQALSKREKPFADCWACRARVQGRAGPEARGFWFELLSHVGGSVAFFTVKDLAFGTRHAQLYIPLSHFRKSPVHSASVSSSVKCGFWWYLPYRSVVRPVWDQRVQIFCIVEALNLLLRTFFPHIQNRHRD